MTRERVKGFEAAMALWAINDLQSASTMIVSCANRLRGHADRGELERLDIINIQRAAEQVTLSLNEIKGAIAKASSKVAA